MANTTPTFLRRFEVFAPILAGKSAPILESTHITLGFSGPIDTESGMVLNLVEVDTWIKEFKANQGKKSFASRWDFCRYVKTKFIKLIDRTEFTDIRIEFHDWGARFVDAGIVVKWTRQAEISSGKLKWRSPVTLTMRVNNVKALPLTKAIDTKIGDSLQTIRLDKLKWTLTGLTFLSFEYMDPKLACSVRVSEITLK